MGSLSQYAGSQLLNRDENLFSGSGYGGQIQYMRDQQLRQQLKREAEKKQAELETKQNEGGILGAVLGAIGGGVTGFVSGGPAMALVGAAKGGMQGFTSGRESGSGVQGGLSATLSAAGDAATKYLTDQASAKELAQKKELLSQQAQQEFDKSALTQGLIPSSQTLTGKSVVERLGTGESIKPNESGGLSVYAQNQGDISIPVGDTTRYYKPFISPEKQAEMDLKESIAKQTALDKKESASEKLRSDNYWKSLNAELKKQSLDLTRMGIETSTALKVAQINQQNQNRMDKISQHEKDVIAKNRTSDGYTKAKMGLDAITNAIDIYNENPDVTGFVGSAMGLIGRGKAGEFKSSLKLAADNLKRLQSGMATTKAEDKTFSLITNPEWYNDPENKVSRLQTLQNIYKETLDRYENPYRKPVSIENFVPSNLTKKQSSTVKKVGKYTVEVQ